MNLTEELHEWARLTAALASITEKQAPEGTLYGRAVARIEALEAALEKASGQLHHIMRTAEMSSGIMLDKRRTGNWPGAQKTADAFDRIGLRAAEAKANVRADLATSETKGLEQQ